MTLSLAGIHYSRQGQCFTIVYFKKQYMALEAKLSIENRQYLVKELEYEILPEDFSNFDLRYENIIKSTERKDEEEKSNILLSSLRAKGYKITINSS